MLGTNTLEFSLTSPINQMVLNTTIGVRPISVSGCILPGFDPRGKPKECQDSYHFFTLNNSLFCLLFDGHGSEGHHVSKFCTNYIEKFIRYNYNDFIENPKNAILTVLETCDKELENSGINIDYSGSTGILLFIRENSIHTGCLGDSRAILGTLTESEFPYNKPTNPYAREYSIRRMLKPIPLTTDQKPDNAEEIVRIRKSGGIVEKFKDSFSVNGHYRVCLPECDSALSMTRSLGDKTAKKFGISSVPVYQYFSMYSTHDQYIILASDGIWDVMQNIEAVSFLEMCQAKCSEFIDDSYPANFKNSTFARMLSEECRYRWLHFVQNEAVVIDDIACIVVNFANDNILENYSSGKSLEKTCKAFKNLEI